MIISVLSDAEKIPGFFGLNLIFRSFFIAHVLKGSYNNDLSLVTTHRSGILLGGRHEATSQHDPAIFILLL